jgi:AhpD family alkylhydroperoxidase
MDLQLLVASLYAEAGVDEMQSRIEIQKVAPGAFQAMLALEGYVKKSSKLETSLLELVRMRASQINGCAYCLDMHSKDARAGGESEQRLYALNAWREAPFFTDRERSALAWTEAVTLVSQDHVPQNIYEEVRRRFSEEELANLTLAIASINSWNRLMISFRAMPGTYQPPSAQHRPTVETQAKNQEGGRS